MGEGKRIANLPGNSRDKSGNYRRVSAQEMSKACDSTSRQWRHDAGTAGVTRTVARAGLCLVRPRLFSAACFGIRRRRAGAIPSATVPPSSYQSGLITTPNPIDSSSNLPITGNVLGGKHFRGNIPYDSTTSFGAPLGSTSLDSFLRYSAVPQAQGRLSPELQPLLLLDGHRDHHPARLLRASSHRSVRGSPAAWASSGGPASWIR